MVDNGVLRLNEAKQVSDMLNKDLGVNLTVVDASDLFLSRLEGVEDPEQKRKIIGNTFINIFEEEASKIEKAAEEEEKQGAEAKGRVEWLLQGTLYPDVIESISFKGPSATIKTHHNVGGLLANMKLKLIEPLRELFKGFCLLVNLPLPGLPYSLPDEVRVLGRLLSIPAPLVQRHPFPGPGLAIRILGPVTRDQVKILQHADSIYIEEIRKADLYGHISQAFAVLLPVKAVGVMGDKRTYEQVRDFPYVYFRISHFLRVIGYRTSCRPIRGFYDRRLVSIISRTNDILCSSLVFAGMFSRQRFCGRYRLGSRTKLRG